MSTFLRAGWVRLAGGLLLALAAFLVSGVLPPQQRVMAAVFVLTVFYWISEPLPLYVTAILAAFLTSLLLGPASQWFGMSPLDYRPYLAAFASPVVVLMFGGFVMATVFSKNNLDIEFCQMILRRLGTRPPVILIGMMLLTATMSMWMSNTATTAIMVATVLPFLRHLPPAANMRRALMLAIPFAANIGGIATPIGTPPNAIAIGLLADSGYQVTFLSWMLASVPVMLALLAVTYGLITIFFPIRRDHFAMEIGDRPATAKRTLVYTTFFATVLLWMTDTFHGIPSALVALLPVVVFAIAGMLPKRRLREISWDILLLIGGGISLGVGIKETGLADTLATSLIPAGLSPVGNVLVMGSAAALLATFMSNTAAGNIILPIALSAAVAAPVTTLIPVALCASYGMALPISTPPNAIAFGSEMIAGRDMFKTGVLVTILGILVTLVYVQILPLLLPSFL